MRLRRNEYCPVHKSHSCCGRELIPKPRLIRLGVQRIEDPNHPRGYREPRSPAEMRKLLNRKLVEQDRECAICREEFTDYSLIVPDHRDPKGMGGAIIRKTSKQPTCGVAEKKDQPERNDLRAINRLWRVPFRECGPSAVTLPWPANPEPS